MSDYLLWMVWRLFELCCFALLVAEWRRGSRTKLVRYAIMFLVLGAVSNGLIYLADHAA